MPNEKKNLPTADKIETGAPNFDLTFNGHIMDGVFHGGQINGLHCLSAKIARGTAIVKADVTEDGRFSAIYKATVTINGSSKTGTFFPDNWSIADVKTAVTKAWRDWKTFGTGPSSAVYKGMKEKYGVSWCGLAELTNATTTQKIWIAGKGSGEGDKPIITAYPAVNNKMF